MNELLVKDLLPDLELATDVKAKVEEAREQHKKTSQSVTWSNGTFGLGMATTGVFIMQSQQMQMQQQQGQQQEGQKHAQNMQGKQVDFENKAKLQQAKQEGDLLSKVKLQQSAPK